jgi:hypothetical protein
VGKFVLTDARLFTGGADLASATNKIDLTASVKDEDVTNFASGGWTESIAGLASTVINGAGFWEAGDPSKVDDAAFAALAAAGGAWTICPSGGGAVGSLAYLTKGLETTYGLGGDVGKVAPWSAKAVGTWPLVRGQIAHPPGTARTATGVGAGINLGAVPAGKQLYTTLHVLSVAGTATPTITVAIESDTSNAFSLPTTRTTFAAATAASGQILRTPGAITDTWWRPKWTIAGTTPSFLFVVAVGIQ